MKLRVKRHLSLLALRHQLTALLAISIMAGIMARLPSLAYILPVVLFLMVVWVQRLTSGESEPPEPEREHEALKQHIRQVYALAVRLGNCPLSKDLNQLAQVTTQFLAICPNLDASKKAKDLPEYLSGIVALLRKYHALQNEAGELHEDVQRGFEGTSRAVKRLTESYQLAVDLAIQATGNELQIEARMLFEVIDLDMKYSLETA